ncbi:plasmid stability protein [Epidermidibacterium keratini]|uniref:Plasmid stability protein n=1 Tax=Epidermidibacterium keratini TaxID=1891644 RepID=A0A7L4YJ32_9ACTN|nr:plasmid stability protein [Epidermidibacterium keratini]QHB99265.1 plasmid stability protein [Epidermidibacterium keratini]
MAAITVRNLSDSTHRALKSRAKSHGRSTEAEVRAILDDAVAVQKQGGLGSRLREIGRAVGGVDLDIDRSRQGRPPVDLT